MKAAERLKLKAAIRARRAMVALLLVLALSFTTVFADDEINGTADHADGTQTEVSTGTEGGGQGTGTDATEGGEEPGTGEPSPEEPSPEEPEPEPEPAASIIKDGNYYYYKDADGVIRTQAGFVTVDGKIYYVRRGGRIRTNATFKVNKKYYRANIYGVIKTGVYKWKGYYNFSYSRGQWKRKAGFVKWKGHSYYVRKGGRIITSDGFVVKNIAYVANSKGQVTRVRFSTEDENPVVAVARKQVGIMTGKTYWVWYYKTRFRDTDRTPWCGAFVAWVYNRAGLYRKISVAKRYGPLGYVPSYSRYADRYHKWVKKKNARPGDIIVFGRNRHVGLVEGKYGNYIVTIEGNAGPTAIIGCGKAGAVVRKIYKLSNKDIKGVIRP